MSDLNVEKFAQEFLSQLVELRYVIHPGDSVGECADGSFSGSLSESVSSITGGLIRVAEAIESLADAVRDRE